MPPEVFIDCGKKKDPQKAALLPVVAMHIK
jgi:hypothetical protein